MQGFSSEEIVMKWVIIGSVLYLALILFATHTAVEHIGKEVKSNGGAAKVIGKSLKGAKSFYDEVIESAK